MSTDIKLLDNEGNLLKVDKHTGGGICTLEGTEFAELNVTYNYAWFWYKFLDKKKGIHFIDGKKAEECIPIFVKCIKELTTPTCFGNGEKPYKDYWAPTPGNACHVIRLVLQWAKQHPDGVFKVYS